MLIKQRIQKSLQDDLISYNPKRWRVNLPWKDYSLQLVDAVPALSGVIGKVSLVAAFAMAWAAGLGISDPTFVAENVRLELVLAGLLTLIFCAFMNPYAGPPGTLATLIPVVPMMALSGVHPLPLGIGIGIIGLAITAFRYFSKLVHINGEGTKGGIILLFGFLGITSSMDHLKVWADNTHAPYLFMLLLAIGLIIYILLGKIGAKWLVIPLCAAGAIALSAFFGLLPVIETGPGLPIISPDVWWNEKWGIGYGLSAEHFIRAVPYALLAVVMWPIDALAITAIQETSYPPEAQKAVIDLNDTYAIVSLRNIVGTFLGGSQVAAVWRSFMIPLGIVKRPVGGSAFILGILAISFGILGFPIDVAIFAPLLWLVLIFGIYVPLIEVGITKIKSLESAQIAAVCIVGGMAINPVIGWVLSVVTENFGIIKEKTQERTVSGQDKIITGALVVMVTATYLLSGAVQ